LSSDEADADLIACIKQLALSPSCSAVTSFPKVI